MNKKNIAYWITTGLIALLFAFGGVMDLSQSAQVKEGMTHLGYPVYFASLLGAWKLLGSAAILAPRLPRLKEWAYAGMFFDLTSASIAHVMAGDSAGNFIPPLVFVLFLAASWALRPASRVLGTLPTTQSPAPKEAQGSHALQTA